MLRDGFCLYLLTLGWGKPKCKCVAALHGSIFTSWLPDSLEARLFRLIIRRCDLVTCLGGAHAKSLSALGIPKDKIVIMPNVCEFDGVDVEFLKAKQQFSDAPVEILFLSSLIDTKGYPEYLEALCLIAENGNCKINATLCGPITITPFSDRFSTVEAAKAWIDQKMEYINASENVRLHRIEGAEGAEKKILFEQSQIFILPTRYKVEAQPLVVIEAMASGCAIITHFGRRTSFNTKYR